MSVFISKEAKSNLNFKKKEIGLTFSVFLD